MIPPEAGKRKTARRCQRRAVFLPSAGKAPRTAIRSVNVDRDHVVLSGQREGEPASTHQRQPLAIGGMHGIENLCIAGLLAHLRRQVSGLNRAHIDDLALGFVALVMMQSLWRITEAPAAEDPFANAESRRWRINQRVYTNTLEQALIFVPVYLGLAIRMAPEHVHMLPAMMAVWCTGRILFWIGFHRTLYARAIGMDWTTVTTFVAAGWFIATLF